MGGKIVSMLPEDSCHLCNGDGLHPNTLHFSSKLRANLAPYRRGSAARHPSSGEPGGQNSFSMHSQGSVVGWMMGEWRSAQLL
ncbi:uncharacterized protein CIMG_13752 [Coccidioides immitis RS]|uniref:Uncharacterized protein n=1 Tax=Coccidioides immitis (strain RS) TaxID=246410 RepID=A0A0D8JW89_COCIM|nr:uncharacterized protein CIMG_13752 [Coccidioides immitis RS]KJF61582.1 hypothetical protein CIMG_13752 [Coccidioides immitis RS]